MKLLYNRLLAMMVLLVALVLFAPLIIYPMLSAPDSLVNLVGASLAVLCALAFGLIVVKLPKFCIKRG